MATGTPGWWKRINNQTNSVDRKTYLNDEHTIDETGEAIDEMVKSAKRAVIKNVKPSIQLPSSSSRLDVAQLHCFRKFNIQFQNSPQHPHKMSYKIFDLIWFKLSSGAYQLVKVVI